MRSQSRRGAGFFRSRSIVALAAIWVGFAVSPAFALDPSLPITAYARTHFTTDDGLLASVVDQIHQTPDGFLWLIVNGGGLTRFDGRSFHDFDIPANSLTVAPDGDLWVGTPTGLLQIPFEDLRHSDVSRAVSYQPGPGAASSISCLRFGRDGVLWVGTRGGLFQFHDGRLSPVGPRVGIDWIEPTSRGHLFVMTTKGFVELDGTRVVPPSRLAFEPGADAKDIFHVIEDRHGRFWYCGPRGLARRSGSEWRKLGAYGPEQHGAFRAYEDPQGNLWVAKAEGLFRATSDGLELAVPKMMVRAMFGDRDGTLWVGTNGDGLHRFRDPAIRMFTRADGLPNDVIMTVLAAQDGSLWTGANCGGVTRFDGTRFRTYDEKDGLLNSCVWALAEDAERDLWIGTFGGGAFRFHQGHFTQLLAGETVIDILASRDGSMWFTTGHGLVRLQSGAMRTYTTADGLSSNRVFRVFEDRQGRILAVGADGLDRSVGDRFEPFSEVPKGIVFPIGEDRSGALFLGLHRTGHALRLERDRIDPVPELMHAASLVEMPTGALWFGANDGFHRVPPGSFERSRDRDEPLDDEHFGTPDGLSAAEISGGDPSIALDAAGKIWMATPRGLAMLDSRRLSETTRPTTIYMREVTVGRETRPAPRELLLSPGTSHVEIHFAAVETSAPEKIRLQYRLDGVDPEWLDAGPQARAIYNSIPSGVHALRVRARNRSGIWDRSGIVYLIDQQPHFYQTGWFLATAIAAGLLVLGGTYRLRVRHLSKQLSARFDERLAERTRVARELHDTFLQTVQGSKLVADQALRFPENGERLLRSMEQLASWLERAIQEGRMALNSLRTSATASDDLADAFREAIEECRSQAPLTATFSATGHGMELHPIVRHEVYRIGYEAIRNACRHSGADTVKVTLEHAHDLTLQVLDNGVGMDAAIVERGKDGHFGLRGMRERAQRIDGKLTIASWADSGTSITLAVPGSLAYRGQKPGRLKRITSAFSRD